MFVLPTGEGGADERFLLYGLERNPTVVELDGKKWNMQLRRLGVELPLTLHLIDFIKEDYANSPRAKSFASKVKVDAQGVDREMTIRMNKPLRYKGWTFYQKSFEQFPDGMEVSSFAVVFNRGRTIPYIGTFVTGFGMLWHFIGQLATFSRRQLAAKGAAA